MNKIKLNVFDEEVKLEFFADTYVSNQSLAIEAIEEETGRIIKQYPLIYQIFLSY